MCPDDLRLNLYTQKRKVINYWCVYTQCILINIHDVIPKKKEISGISFCFIKKKGYCLKPRRNAAGSMRIHFISGTCNPNWSVHVFWMPLVTTLKFHNPLISVKPYNKEFHYVGRTVPFTVESLKLNLTIMMGNGENRKVSL